MPRLLNLTNINVVYNNCKIMTDVFSKSKRSSVMSKIRSKNTKPELLVRKFLFANKFRYRLHVKGMKGQPDIVLKKYRTVIFVNGCFWHGHNCKAGLLPKSNIDYWLTKIQANIIRDKLTYESLENSGWRIIIIWECDLRKNRNDTLDKLQNELKV